MSDTQDELVEELRARNEQLERALESRIVIEQAKGVLAERFRVSCVDAFDLMRRASRSNRVRGVNFSLPTNAQFMGWSDPARIVVSKPTFVVGGKR